MGVFVKGNAAVFAAVLGCAGAMPLLQSAQAQTAADWPNKPVRFICPFPQIGRAHV